MLSLNEAHKELIKSMGKPVFRFAQYQF